MSEYKDRETNEAAFRCPSRYRIVVKGTVPESWSERLAGMEISLRGSSTGDETMLVGQLRDQAELNGVLETLYSLHLAIIDVKKISQDVK